FVHQGFIVYRAAAQHDNRIGRTHCWRDRKSVPSSIPNRRKQRNGENHATGSAQPSQHLQPGIESSHGHYGTTQEQTVEEVAPERRQSHNLNQSVLSLIFSAKGGSDVRSNRNDAFET